MLDNRSTTIDRSDLEQAEHGHTAGRRATSRATFRKLAFRFGIMAVLLFVVFGGFWYFNHMRDKSWPRSSAI